MAMLHPIASVRAFTLVEAMLSMLVVAILLVAALNAVGVVARQRAAIEERSLAAGFAESTLASITRLHYADPSGLSTTLGLDDTESAPDTWDDVDDASSSVERTGPKLGAAIDWRWTASVEWVVLDATGQVGAVSASDTGLKRVTVVVTRGGHELARSWALRSRGWDEVAR
jgi:type II secretory pathway pseudopilin PulG